MRPGPQAARWAGMVVRKKSLMLQSHRCRIGQPVLAEAQIVQLQYPDLVEALGETPDGTVVDGEVVA